MKIKKAIEILNLSRDPSFEGDSHDFYDAVQLGIEALKHIDHNRLVDNHPDQAKLPGETKE